MSRTLETRQSLLQLVATSFSVAGHGSIQTKKVWYSNDILSIPWKYYEQNIEFVAVCQSSNRLTA